MILGRRRGRRECLSINLSLWGHGSRIPKVGFVAFVKNIAENIGPGDRVGASDEMWMCDRSEGFANVGGICDVAMGGEEDGSGSICICGVSEGGFRCVDVTVKLLVYSFPTLRLSYVLFVIIVKVAVVMVEPSLSF